MLFEYNYPFEQSAFYLIVITALMSLAAFSWKFRRSPGAKPQLYGLVCKGGVLSCIVLSSSSAELQDKIFWLKLHQMMSILSGYLWAELIIQISDQGRKIPVWMRPVFWTAIGFLWVLILSPSLQGYLWREIWLDGLMVKGFSGPVLIAAKGLSAFFGSVALLASVRWAMTTVGLRRKQAVWFTLSGLLSLLGVMLNNFAPTMQRFAPLPLGFLLGGLLVTWAFYRWQTYNILPLAQEAVIRNMTDGLVVVDEFGFIAEMNQAAKLALHGLPAAIGGEFEVLARAWPALKKISENPGLESMEAMREGSEGSRYYQLSIASLESENLWLGKVILLKDVTEQKKTQSMLMEQQKALSIIAERERLGRELHDGPGQLWSYIHVQVEAVRSLLDKKDTAQAELLLKKLAGVTQEIHVDLRESITGLQLSATDEQGVWHTIAEYLQWFEQNYGIVTHLSIDSGFSSGLLSPTTEVQLLRIVQEALTNIRKHAGAHHVKVLARMDGDWAEVRVEDDGCGADFAVAAGKKGSFGLKIMRERAAEIGARISVQSKPNAGTRIILQIPLAAGGLPKRSCAGAARGEDSCESVAG